MNEVLNKEDLANIDKYDDFFALSRKLSQVEDSELFDFLFPLAISQRTTENINGIAGLLLVDLEPKHTRSCQELLDEMAHSKWFVSNKEVPFYLVSQFGKWNLFNEYKTYVSSAELSEQQQRRIETIIYWASSPTAKLAYDLHYWEWQEVIEAED
jgi:hypothetical protein